MSSAGASAAEVVHTLQVLASRLSADGHPLQAIKCYVAMLSQSMLPSDEAAARLRLGQLLMEHTLNVQDAKQQLQKAEMLVMPLPGQHLLKCEVLAGLATAHQTLGEVDFQRRCYTKGLDLCKDKAANSADKRCLAEWSIYFHLHLAESMVAKGQTEDASKQVEQAAALAGSQALLQQQVLCNLFQLQLSVMQFDKQDASTYSSNVTKLLQQCEQQRDLDRASLAYMRLHFNMLQLMMLLQTANYKEIQGDAKEQKGPKQHQQQQQAPLIEQMDGLLQQLSDIQQRAAIAGQPHQRMQAYEWLSMPVMTATVQLLAALVDKNAGRTKPGQKRITDGLQALDSHLTLLLQDKASADAPAQSSHQHNLRACLGLRLMLLETRQQLHLLCSDFVAARADAFGSMRVLNQFPRLLSGLRPVVHIQAGLYSQAVGSFDSAAQHFMAAANEAQGQGSVLLAADARHLAAMCYVSQNTAESVKLAREVLGPISTEGDTSMGYGSRCLYHTAAGFLQLSGANVSSDERADAKQHFSRALKMAHKHLHNHQVVSQLLMMMAPLQVAAADVAGAKQMLGSCTQLSHGAGDLHTQVAALKLAQTILGNDDEAARNRNYAARKEEELSVKMQEAESDAQQHHAVLTWGLN